MIRIFVGCAANHEDAESQAVLEWSIRKHASAPVEIVWMKLARDPASPFYSNPEKGAGWNTTQWATPFSGFRWIVPALCNFQGRAIYMDSDVIVQADIAELWRQELAPGRVVLAKGAQASWRYCVSLWDCEKARAHFLAPEELRRDPNAHRRMVRYFASHPGLVQAFQGDWNCLDGEEYDRLDDPQIKAIHYTAMRYQPQLPRARARLAAEGREHWFDGMPATHWRSDLIALFETLLDEAESQGYTVASYCRDPLFGAYRKKSVAGVGNPRWVSRHRLAGEARA